MLETSRLWSHAFGVLGMLLLAGCVTAPEPQPAPPAPRVQAPPGPSSEALAAAAAEEARALLAQAETDVQRARAKRALWSKAWEDLVAARDAMGAKDSAMAAQRARSAS